MLRAGGHGGRRLSAVDTQMLEYQPPGTTLLTESAWLLTYKGPAPSIDELRKHLASRLPLLPRLREKVSYPKLGLARPYWTPDPDFDLRRHVCEADRIRYGDESGRLRLAAELLESRLDRQRPLWCLWLAPGTDEERFAIVFHHNHALADGHSALHILRLLLAATPMNRSVEAKSPVSREQRARGRLREAAEGARSILAANRLLYPPAPSVPALNRPLGPRRRAMVIDLQMKKVIEIATGLGCFPNDVYVTAVAGGLRHWLEGRGAVPPELTLQAGIPVKTMSSAGRDGLGNHFSGIRLLLPLGAMEPIARLRRVQAETKRIGEGRIARGGELMSRAHDLLPRQLLAPLARLEWGPTAVNVVISHLALPGALRQCMGRQLERLACWTPLFEDQPISIVAAQGLNGKMTVNFLVDPELVPDTRALEVGMMRTVDTLHALAVETASAGGRSPGVVGLEV